MSLGDVGGGSGLGELGAPVVGVVLTELRVGVGEDVDRAEGDPEAEERAVSDGEPVGVGSLPGSGTSVRSTMSADQVKS